MRKVGIFGGTFDPVHWGHVVIAETALAQVDLERVIWVPDRCSPNPRKHSLVDFEHRKEMINLAIANHPAFTIYPEATHRTGSSYAIATLHNLQKAYPHSQWYWIIGLDAFQKLSKWYRCRELASACHWLVAPRSLPSSPPSILRLDVENQAYLFNEPEKQALLSAGTPIEEQPVKLLDPPTTHPICEQVITELAAQEVAVQWEILQLPSMAVSSSLIRRYCFEQRSIHYLVPDPIRIYIETHQLYQNPP